MAENESSKRIFRKSALERLSSPEQLDQLMRITNPMGWFAILAIGFLLICALCWGVWGSIATEVSGSGILMKEWGLYNINAHSSGRVDRVFFKQGDSVKAGDLVASIAQRDLSYKIPDLKQELSELKTQYKDLKRFETKLQALKKKNIKQQQRNLKMDNEALEKQASFLKQKLNDQTKLEKAGLITRQKIIKTKSTINQLYKKIRENENQIQLLEIEYKKSKNEIEQKLQKLSDKIKNKKSSLKEMQARFAQDTRVISPLSGKVLEVFVEKGDQVNQGASLLNLEVKDSHSGLLETVLFVPASKGEKIDPGMTAHISPKNIKKDKYGSMIGLVTFVSDFPSSPKGMSQILDNPDLVKEFSKQGAPIKIRVELLADPRNKSGYQWTSSKGPPMLIGPGTICTASIVVERQIPLGLVIPYLKGFLK